jgi:FkbM family methyltransferase
MKTNQKSSIIGQLFETKSIYLYGAGTIGKEVINILTDQGLIVKSFIDKKMPRTSVEGISVLKPDDETFSMEEKENSLVILSFFNAYVSIVDIINYLKKIGWRNIVTFLEFHNQFSYELGNRYWLTRIDYYADKIKLIEYGSDLWADSKSKDLYNSIINFRLTMDYSKLPDPQLDKQYFPEDVPGWEYPLNFVDCGAFDGDTLRYIRKNNISANKIAAFEPDLSNYKLLVAECSTLDKEISLFPCGVWSSSTQLKFNSGGGSGSALNNNGNTIIQCVSIDETLINFRPNLIKMDIEGAEFAALIGAKNTIITHKPGLAICLYHNPEHIWQIPLLIKSWNLDYTFYLRCHYFSGFELVMYAIPNRTS